MAPASRRAGTMVRLGASRMSSVLGLKVRPSTAMVLPATEPPQCETILPAMRFLRRLLTSITVSTMRIGDPCWAAVRASARVSFGKQEPP